jgi:gliding motility-associated lipoprotein GldH
MMKKLIVLFVMASQLIACDKSKIANDRVSFDTLVWNKNEKANFEFTLAENQNVNLDIELRISAGFPYRQFKGKVLLTNAQQQRVEIPIQTTIRDKDLKYTGEQMGDIIDYHWTAKADTTLPSGKYTIELVQLLESGDLPFIMEIGYALKSVSKK